MDRRCAAGALVALAACIATTAAAPTASNQTALDLYEGASEGCYYNFQHYGEGDRIMTNEPCLNCTCHNRMLMCYLRVCPFTKPIGQDCSVEKRADQCCPIVTCPDVPVDLLTSTSTSSPSEYGETGLGKLDRYGCSINGKYFPEGAKVPPSPNKPCEHCYCIRNMTTCVMQECTLHVDGCTPIYRKDVCCPVRYSCDHPEDEIPLLDDMTTTVRPTPGFLLTTTTLSPVTQMSQDCVHDDKIFADGALIKTEKACEHCYCMKGDIVCVVQECGTPMENEGKNCTSMPPREGQCCPDTYICEGDELTTETKPDMATVTSFQDITTLSPPRRVSVEGSGYRNENDEPSTDVPMFEPDSEGSGDAQPPFKPTEISDMLIPESETSPPFIATAHDDIEDKYSPSTTEIPESDKEMAEKATTEADKGVTTAQDDTDKYSPSATEVPEYVKEMAEKATETDKRVTTAQDDTDKYSPSTTQVPEYVTEMTEKATTEADKTVTTVQDDTDKYSPSTTEVPEYIKEMAEKATTEADMRVTTAQGDADKYNPSTTEVPESVKEMAEKATTEADMRVTTAQGDADKYNPSTTEVPESVKEMAEKATTEADKRVTTAQDDTDKYSPSTTEISESDKEMAENATTEGDKGVTTAHDDIADKYSPTTTEVSESDKEMAEKATTEADKGENTVPSGDIDEDTSEASVQDKTSLLPENTTSKLEAVTDPSVVAKTTALPEGEISVKDKTTSQEITATEQVSIAESTIADYELHTSIGSRTTPEGEYAETTMPTRRKDNEINPTEITTLKHSEESSTKASDLIAPGAVVTESTTSSFIEHETETSTSKLPEKENDITEPTTEMKLELTTKSDVIKSDTESATTVQPEIAAEISTLGKVDFTDTTSANPIENEIDEDSFSTLAPGRIPGEGDCLLDGVTYSHESIVPSRSNCHTSCRCISSIVKCEQIICSPPPDYMDNCQPMYDSPESCCPTYVCDHPKETVPPQSHSQMAGTESSIPTPTIECDGDQCEVVKDKEDAKPSVPCTSESCNDDSSKKHVDTSDCGPQGCGEVQTKPEEQRPLEPAEDCAGDSCSSPPVDCASGNCETPIPKDQTCDNENGCEIPAVQTCQGDNCAIQPTKPDKHHPLEPAEECAGDSCSSPPVDCASGNCEPPIPKDQTCGNENGCEIPAVQTCQGDNCAIQPDVTTTKNDSTPCDNPKSCKNVHIPDKASECKGESCISESPTQTIPQEKQDCKDDGNCAQQTPAAEECNEENCKRQQLPEIHKPSPSDCTGTECKQQDIIPKTTEVPEINTGLAPKVTGLHEEPETKPEEAVTNLPQTADIKTETEPSTTTKVSISDKEREDTHEELGTTPQYDESDSNKETEPKPIVPESPEKETSEGQQQESITESSVDKETTMVKEIIAEVTPAFSEAPTTEISSLPDEDTKEITTVLPSFVDTKSPESITSIDNAHTDTSVTEEAAKDKDALDIITTEPSLPAVHSTSTDKHQETIESQEMLTTASDSFNRDGHEETTKEPEYVQDTEPKVTEPTERYTSAPDQITEKLDLEPIEGQEPQGAPTTPKSYEIQTNVPGALETDVPMMEVLHSSTFVPETLTSTQEEESELPVSTLTSEEPTSDKTDKIMDTVGGVSSPDTKAETKSPVNVDKPTAKPEMAHDESETQSPELDVTPGEESITRAPVVETEIQTESSKPFVTLPQENATEESGTKEKDIETPAPITVSVQTESPMSIVKDYGYDEISSTITPESGITTARDEIITKEPESPESQQSTESIAKPTETPSEKPVEIEKMPSNVEYVGATTEKSGADLGTTISEFTETILATKQPVHDSDITDTPEADASTDTAPVSVPIIIETISSKPSVTEASIQESSAQREETSESAPFTSIPGEDIQTKSPVSVTESSGQLITEGVEIITPAQDLSNENTDATELPELVIHEHPTEPSSIVKESDQPATEDTATILPDTAVKEQDITPKKDTSDVPSPQDDVTVAPEIPKNELEVTAISEQESVTKMPDLSQSETTESKPVDASQIPELSPTESQKEVTEGPDSQTITTNAPETVVTDAQKEATEAPAIQTTITSGTKISEAEPQESVTEGVDVQYTVTDADLLVTQPHKHNTDAPVSSDMITNTPDMDTEPHKESMNKTEESEMEPHKQTTGIHDITTTIPEMSSTGSHKPQKPTEAPYSHDAVTKVSDLSPTESTSVPKISATEPQEQTTSVPEAHDAATNIPETEPKMDVTETSVAQDLTTSIPAVPVTENVPLEDIVSPMVQEKATSVPEIYATEPQKEGSTETLTHIDASTNAPAEHTTESQKEVTDSPAAQDAVTNVPDTSITESEKYTQSPELEVAATSAPKLPETEPKKETTESPVQETSSAIPDISEIEPKKEVTEMPEIQVITDASEISDDSKAPTTTSTESQAGVTNIPEGQDATTNSPEVQTESQKEATEIQETPAKTITEAQNEPTEPPESQNSVADLSEVLTTESQKEATEIPDISMTTALIAPEMLATKSDNDVTEAPEQVTKEVTKTPELEATEATGNEAETEKPTVTEKDEIFTETPLKMTTKFDDHTQSTPQEFITSTKSSNIESDTSLPTESGLPVEQFTKVTESLVTESPDKTSGSDSDLDKPSTGMAADEKKPQEGHEIGTETPFVEPTKTVSPISPESIEPDTKAPEIMDSETSTIAPELTVTEKQDHTQAPESEPQGSRRTEATSAPDKEEEVVTKAPQTLEPQDKTTKVFEEPEQTSDSKTEYSETTPYLVLLEEHTHKTVSPDEDVTISPSDVPLKEYEPSTPEVTIDKVTEPVPSTEPEKSPEDVISDKDQSMPELTQTTIAEKSTESSLVSEEITTISPPPESLGTKKPQYDESNEISTSAPMTDQEQSETEKPSVPSAEAETEKEVDVTSQKPPETTAPEKELIYATTKATTLKEEPTTISPLLDKFGTSDDEPKPAAESEKPKPDTAEEVPKPGANEVQPTEEAVQPEEEAHFPPSGTSGYGQEPDYGEEDSFGPGTCRYGGKVYVSAQQIPRDDPCDFCFCFRSDIICLQQSCPPPIHGCHEEPIQGFCCPRYECPVSMATTLNVTTTTTTTTTTLPPHFLPHAYKGAAQRRGCQIKGHSYKVGEVVRASSGPCLHCTCGGDGQMKCDPKVCTPEPMLRQMIAAAVSSKRRR